MIQNNTNASRNRILESLMKLTGMLVVLAIAGVISAAPLSAQSAQSANTKIGSILGTVLDTSGDPIPGASVLLQMPASGHITVTTKEDGSFAFQDVAAGISYQVTVTAEGFAQWSSSVTVEPGQKTTLNDVKLRILAAQRAMTVHYSANEVAAQQLKVEEQQRVLGFIPNIYVVYDPHPEPLTAKMKFHLAYKSFTNPTMLGFMAAWAGVQQAAHTPDWPQNGKGYSYRYGANLAGAATEGLFGNAILPVLFHQDPRYYYRGTGTTWSRVRYAMVAPFVCPGDNGKLQPNYSEWGGLLISGALANTYYPNSNRGAGLLFRNFGTNMGLHVFSSLAQEFILARFTSKHKH